MTGPHGEVVITVGTWTEIPGPPEYYRREDVRKRAIVREAASCDRVAEFWRLEGDLDKRDAYRDMAAALRLLADERGT